ncbi:MAG: DNA helicase [Isosphaeraceae bacterium]|jgi:DNA helicase-2/ATP-dependent DNA helicase PcrA|nr:MAG: DNA helicase [Isosphaeraceae bacterium]
MDLLSDLTPAQREAVTHVDGPLLVLAGAGSGKTRVITRRVGYLLARGIPRDRILALTFTNKAAGEMRERIEALMPGSGVWVGTFHALGARLLRQFGHLLGLERHFTIYDQADRLRTIRQVMDQLGVEAAGVSAEQVEAIVSRAKNAMGSPDQVRSYGRDEAAAIAAQVFPAYQQRLRELSAVDFDDLLNHTVAIFRTCPEVRAQLDAQFRYLLVDEYQDTNLAQYAIVRALSLDHPNVCVTGDPDQSIYGWRGANLSNILEFEKDFRGVKVVKLEQNYRSTKTILRVADHLIRHNRLRKPKRLITENPVGPPVELATYETELEEAQAIAGRIAAMVRSGERTYRDVAIFVRVSSLTRPIENALRSAQVPYQVVGGLSFYERQEIKDLLAYAQLAVNLRNDVAFERIINVPPRGIGPITVERLRQSARVHSEPLLAAARHAGGLGELKEKAVRALRDFVWLIDELASWRDRPAEALLRHALELSNLGEFFAAGPDGADRTANLDELLSAARQFDREHPGATIAEFLEEVSLATSVDRWDEDAGAVALMTLHAAKGLEFPVVFLVGLEEGILPHARSAEDGRDREEERRLLFVGITRAREELYLSHVRIRTTRGQRQVAIPSSFLRELPEDALRTVDHTAAEAGLWGRSWPDSREREPASLPRLGTAADLLRASAEPIATGDERLDAFQPGATVLHPNYGLGRIVAIEGAGPNRKGRVRFTVGGEKTFVLARSPLRLVAAAR